MIKLFGFIKAVLLIGLTSCSLSPVNNAKSKIELQYEKVYGEKQVSKGNNTGLNFLLITSDQQHWMTMGYNDSTIKTPNLNRLAERGVVFDRAYCPNPTCTPTRASLVTGQLPSQHGAYALGTKLPEDSRTIGHELSDAGYRTALVGKAHFQPFEGNRQFPSLEASPTLHDLDFWKNFSGPFYGFEHIELARNHGDEAHVGQHYVLWMEEKLIEQGKDPKSWREWFRKPTGTSESQYGKWNIPEEFHLNIWIAERTNRLLEQYTNKHEAFFIWSSFFDPHPPYLVPGKWAEMYDPDEMNVPDIVEGELVDMPEIYRMTQEKGADWDKYKDNKEMWSAGFQYHVTSERKRRKDMAVYYGQISMMDHYIGMILDKIDSLGIADKTVIVFTSDHGNVYGQHGLVKKGPFMYEDLVKVPMIVSCPGTIPQGKRNNSLQSLIDYAPSFLGFAGIEKPGYMTGVDQSDVWKDSIDNLRDYVIVENHQQPFSLYQKQLVTKRYKLTVYMNAEYGELFDLENDPNELNNLWDKEDYSSIKNQLIHKLLQSAMKKEPVLMRRLGGA